MRTMGAAKAKAHLLELPDEVAPKRLVSTKDTFVIFPAMAAVAKRSFLFSCKYPKIPLTAPPEPQPWRME